MIIFKKNYKSLIISINFGLFFWVFSPSIFAQNEIDSLIIVATQYNNEGISQFNQKQYKAAENFFKQSIAEWNKISVYNEYSSYPHYQLATLYRMLGDFDMSFFYYNNSVKILLNAPPKNSFILGGVYTSIGNFYISFGDKQKALDYFEQAREVLFPFKVERLNLYSAALYGTAFIYYTQKDYAKVIAFSRKCLKEGVSNNDEFLQIIANSYVFLNQYDEAIQMLNELSDFYLEKSESDYAYNLLFLARAHTKSGDLKQAETYFSSVLPILQRIKPENDPWMIFYYELFGQLLMEKGKVETCSYVQLGYYSEAVNVFDRALILNSRNNDNKIPYLESKGDVINPTQVKDVFNYRTNALNQIGAIYEKQNDWFIALNFYNRALNSAEATIQFLHDFRISFLEEESKISLSEKGENIYLDGFKIAEYLYEKTQLPKYFESMLNFSESGKSAVFLASLNEIRAKNFGGIPDSLIQMERNVQLQLNSIKQTRNELQGVDRTDTALLAELDKSIFNLQSKQEELNFLYERDYPEYYQFKYKNVSVTSIEIVGKLKKDQALIEYFIDEPVSITDTGYIYSMVFQSTGYYFEKTKINYEFIENIQNVMAELTDLNIGDTNLNNFRVFTKSANHLYHILIEPLKLGKKVSDLIVIPDGKLAYIPFDALLTKLPDNQKIDFRSLNYLIYDYSVTYSYSATLHFDYFKTQNKKGNNILAYAPEYGLQEIEINNTAYRNNELTRALLRPLPGAREEVLGLSKFQDCNALLGAEASETSFKQLASGYDILHLAMHTVINDSLPMFSKLVFSTLNDTIEDGYLNTQEIYNLKLNARLAVLSACNTGSGIMRGGEGVMSLSRAFLYAGCPSIVMTLWEVEDKVSADIMLSFYRFLFKGYSKSEALRKAKLEHIINADPLKAHPYFWQGYMLVGDPSPIKLNNNVLISILIFSAILVMFGHFLSRHFKRRKKAQ